MVELRHGEGGFSAPIMVLIMAMMVLFIGGISIDLWRIIADHREVASLVDGAAVAGATAVDLDAFVVDPAADPILDPPLATRRVCRYMADHAGVDRCPSEVVTVDFAPDLTAVEVGLYRDVELTFLRVVAVGAGPIVVHSSAVVELQRGTPASAAGGF